MGLVASQGEQLPAAGDLPYLCGAIQAGGCQERSVWVEVNLQHNIFMIRE